MAERGWVPDPLVRRGIRSLIENRTREIRARPDGAAAVVEAMRRSPLAIATDSANEQHYELPPEFFQAVLGRHLKYSACYWPEGVDTLDEAEARALELACERAAIEDGMRVLDLGCGWGSLSLWIAESYPGCRVTAVSNSSSQGDFIRARAADRGLGNVEVLTADMAHLQLARRFERVVSVEMFEHMRNYAALLERVAGWLEPDGRLFIHIFCHRSQPYFFEDEGPDDWMARHFFTGGLMPSERLLDAFAGPVQLEKRWRVNGRHYEKTARAWLVNLDRRRDEVRAIFSSVYGRDSGRWLGRWRMFFLACAELFGYGDGEEWFISHSRWAPGDRSGQRT